jgi:hypothetical protein
MRRLVQHIAAQLRVIGRVRPNILVLEAQAVAELFALVVPRRPVAMRLPFDERNLKRTDVLDAVGTTGGKATVATTGAKRSR